MVNYVSPVHWLDVEGLDATSPTPSVATAVQLWLNEKNLDLANLSLEDLAELVEHLKTQYPNSPDIASFVQKLEVLQRQWTDQTPGRDLVQNAIRTIDFQIRFLTLLNGVSPGDDAIDTALKNLSGFKSSLLDLGRMLISPPIDWSADQNASRSLDFADKLIEKLEALTPDQRKALGLEGLYANVKAARAAYASAESAAGGDATKLALAQSSFRTALGEAMVSHMSSAGLGTSSVAASWRHELEQEANFYTFLSVPMDEGWIPPRTGFTVESLDTAWQEADRMHRAAVARGDTVAAHYFLRRKEIISDGRARIAEATSPSDKFWASIALYSSLLSLNEARLNALLTIVRGTDDQDLADKIQSRINLIKELQSEVKKGGIDLHERLAAVYQASRV